MRPSRLVSICRSSSVWRSIGRALCVPLTSGLFLNPSRIGLRNRSAISTALILSCTVVARAVYWPLCRMCCREGDRGSASMICRACTMTFESPRKRSVSERAVIVFSRLVRFTSWLSQRARLRTVALRGPGAKGASARSRSFPRTIPFVLVDRLIQRANALTISGHAVSILPVDCIARLGATAVSFLDHPDLRSDSCRHGA